MESEQKQYKYYAFISYSHNGSSKFSDKIRKIFPESTLFAKNDMRWGIWLQKKLESFRLPAVISKNFGIDPKQRIKPVFRDENELGCGVLDNELHKNLDNSKYLIVVCSPNSANPNREGVNHVDNEIKHFINKNGTERVIPVIVNGIPNDSEQNCFPPEIKKHNFVAIDITKLGEQHALSNIVAKMLNLAPDELWEREKRRLIRRRILLSGICLFIFAILAFAGYWRWDWNRDYVKCYADYVDKYGLPQGIFPLEKKDIANRYEHYRFIYCGRKTFFGDRVLREVMRCNSKGYYLDKSVKRFDEHPIRQQFEYRDGFILVRINVVDRNGKVLEQRNYSGTNMTCIDFKQRGSDGRELGKNQNSIGLSFSAAPFQSKSEIRRWLLKRDENGYLTEIRFCKDDSREEPAKNADGFYGVSYELDQYGRPIKLYYLGYDGKKIQLKDGISSVRYDYQENTSGLLRVASLDVYGKKVKEYQYVLDENQNFREQKFYFFGKPAYEYGRFKVKQVYLNGNLIEEAYFGIDGKPCLHKDGVAKVTVKYDDRGNRIEAACFGIDGKPCLHKDGVAKVTVKYDDRGNRIEAACFGIDDKLCLDKDGVAKVTAKYDKRGNPIETAYFGIDGKPCLHKDGYAKGTKKYDERGNLIEAAYFGIDGKSCLHKDGYAKGTAKYESGNLIEWAYFGIDGKPCLDKDGVAKFTKKYDERGNPIETAFFGIDGKPCLYKNGVAKWTSKYDERGNLIEAACFGIDGKPCLNKDGYAKDTKKYDERGNQIEKAYFGIDGKLCINKDGFAKVTAKYDERGNQIEAAFFGIDDKLCLNKDGYAKGTAKYDERGNQIEAACFGIDGKPCLHKDGYAKDTKKYDERGNQIEAAYFGIDGKPCLYKDGYAKVTAKYDERGNRIEAACFGIDDKLCLNKDGYAKWTEKYDERGNQIEAAYFGIDDKPCLHKDGYAKVTKKYDERGNWIEAAYFGIDGKPCLHKDGYAKFTGKYDERGNQIEAVHFGIDGKLCLHKDGYAKVTVKYDERGNLIEVAYFGIYNKPCLHKNGVAKWTSKYDERGNLIETACFGIDGKPCISKGGFAKFTQKYDEYDTLLEFRSYGINGQILIHGKFLITVTNIMSYSQSKKINITPTHGDIILDYAGADWTNGNINMIANIQRVRNNEKRLVFARKNPDGSYHIFSKTFPAGMIGIEMNGTLVDIKEYNKIMEVYKKFKKDKEK